MHATKETLLQKLNTLGINGKVYEHEPVFTVEEAIKVVADLHIPGTGVKNLFLKDSKKNVYLIVAVDNAKIQLKEVGKKIGAPELRFTDAHMLQEYLGVTPGSVTPLALINDTKRAVKVIFDSMLFEQTLLQVHPLVNTATVVITPNDLKKFIAATGHPSMTYEFSLSPQ
jgi:Ala-tRNA(Pro) deacylase